MFGGRSLIGSKGLGLLGQNVWGFLRDCPVLYVARQTGGLGWRRERWPDLSLASIFGLPDGARRGVGRPSGSVAATRRT